MFDSQVFKANVSNLHASLMASHGVSIKDDHPASKKFPDCCAKVLNYNDALNALLVRQKQEREALLVEHKIIIPESRRELALFDAIPISDLFRHIPESFQDLESRLFSIYHGEVEDITPRELPSKQKANAEMASAIYEELQAIQQLDENSPVVIIRAHFRPTSGPDFRYLEEFMKPLALHTLGLSYLICELAPTRSNLNSWILFGDKNEKGHLRMYYEKSNGFCKHSLPHRAHGGYECLVMFAYIAKV